MCHVLAHRGKRIKLKILDLCLLRGKTQRAFADHDGSADSAKDAVLNPAGACATMRHMGFNKRRMDSERAAAAAKEAAARRALGQQVVDDAERLVADWNARQEGHMPMLFSPTIGAATAAGYWFLWVRCLACRTT